MIFGGGGDDVIFGYIPGQQASLDGDDSASNDNDVIFAGKGDDCVTAGPGDDVVYAGAGGTRVHLNSVQNETIDFALSLSIPFFFQPQLFKCIYCWMGGLGDLMNYYC